MRGFTAATGTHLAAPYWLPTWPTWLSWGGIPIDVTLGSADIRFSNMTRLPGIGSDHRGYRVLFGVDREDALRGGPQPDP
jgi:hypothetical protein